MKVRRHRSGVFGIAVILALLALPMLVAKEAKVFVPPLSYHANTYPAHEQQASEHLTIAADPYDMADKAAIFSVDYKAAGFLPVMLIISNDGDTPLSLANLKLELVTVDREKIEPALPDQIYRRITKTKRPDEVNRMPLPVPLPKRKPKQSVSADAKEEIETAQFKALAIEPKMSRSGFYFFDVEGLSTPLAGTRLYVSGLRNAEGHEILYFEIPMEKYLTYRPPKP